ncbi:MAG: VOC family protein [Alphaproteobacteria bacterium]|nr:VOC family protein [Alphaproteobacteria bacterium]MBL7100210.1 VOC family protein [Alphaproteobacteria bacterium]
MPVEMLEHYTVRCESLERTRDFYRDVLGLTDGDRPNFPFKGYWMYLGGVPVVHLVDAQESVERDGPQVGVDTAALDHIAFRGKDIEATRATFKARNLKFRENAVPGGRIHQIFVRDPDGILIELNFRKG